MKFSILTIFPEMFDGFREHDMVRRAIAAGQVSIAAVDIREFALDRHRTTDDRPYGGGCGMVMTPGPLDAAIRRAREENAEAAVVHVTPQGRPFDQAMAERLARLPGLIFLCGRYEGIDERIACDHTDLDISVGDFILTGGELPAMLIMDAVIRLLPGVLGNDDSAENDSFSADRLDYGHYTRPRIFEGSAVPEVLLSGNHADIARWRFETAVARTLLFRPDLLARRPLEPREIDILKSWRETIDALIRDAAQHRPDSPSGDQ